METNIYCLQSKQQQPHELLSIWLSNISERNKASKDNLRDFEQPAYLLH